MYSLVGTNDILKTLITLSYNNFEKNEKINVNSLRVALKKYLVSSNPNIMYSNQLEPHIEQDEEKITLILKILELDNEIDLTKINSETNKNRLKIIINQIKEIEDIYPLFWLSIDTIALTNNIKFPGSASSPNSIGLMWIQPNESWTDIDILESLIHEFTHTLLGFDNLVHNHYAKPSEIMNTDTWVPSAIRNEARPVHGVAHSIIVSTEILNLRKKLKYSDSEAQVHGSTDSLLEKTKNSLNTLMKKKESWDILSDRMHHLLLLAKASVENVSKMGVSK